MDKECMKWIEWILCRKKLQPPISYSSLSFSPFNIKRINWRFLQIWDDKRTPSLSSLTLLLLSRDLMTERKENLQHSLFLLSVIRGNFQLLTMKRASVARKRTRAPLTSERKKKKKVESWGKGGELEKSGQRRRGQRTSASGFLSSLLSFPPLSLFSP